MNTNLCRQVNYSLIGQKIYQMIFAESKKTPDDDDQPHGS
jgi:hypothetical protein